MQPSVRPWITAGVASLGAAALVVTPLPPLPMLPTTTMPSSTLVTSVDVDLTTNILDILTVPALRQYVSNRADDMFTLAAGLGESSAAIVEHLVDYPRQLVLVIRQFSEGDLLGALDTIEEGALATSAAVILPTIASIIERRAGWLEAQTALQVALPAALVALSAGFFAAGEGILQSATIDAQAVVGAVASLDLDKVVDALVTSTVDSIEAIGTGAQSIIDGTATAQHTLATALGTPPGSVDVLPDAVAYRAHVSTVPNGAEFTELTILPPQSGAAPAAPGATPDRQPPAAPAAPEPATPEPPAPAPAPAPADKQEAPADAGGTEPGIRDSGPKESGPKDSGPKESGTETPDTRRSGGQESGKPGKDASKPGPRSHDAPKPQRGASDKGKDKDDKDKDRRGRSGAGPKSQHSDTGGSRDHRKPGGNQGRN